MTCPHGFTPETHPERPDEPIAWAGGVGECRCCGFHFLYTGSATMVGSFSGKGRDYYEEYSPDRTLCTPCGGKPKIVRKGHRPDRLVTDSHGTKFIPGGIENHVENGTFVEPPERLTRPQGEGPVGWLP